MTPLAGSDDLFSPFFSRSRSSLLFTEPFQWGVSCAIYRSYPDHRCIEDAAEGFTFAIYAR